MKKISLSLILILRVAIFRGSDVTLSIDDSDRMNVRFENGGLFLNGKKIPSPLVFKSKSEGRVKVGDDVYRGDIEVRLEEDNFVVINEVSLEEYLFSVVGGEIYSAWPGEVLKAQAVAARTYAVYQYEKNKDKTYQLEASVDSQRYIGIAGENKNISKAVLETRGLVMTYHKDLIQAFFHSTCGGRTEDVNSLWPDSNLPYLESKICSFCRDAANYNWVFSISKSELGKVLLTDQNFKGKLRSLKISKLTRTGRVSEITFGMSNGGRRLNVSDFRRWLGYDKIKSTLFKISVKGNKFVFVGHGSGHGVGLCQEGAKAMADKKYKYDKILKFYYPGVKITRYVKH